MESEDFMFRFLCSNSPTGQDMTYCHECEFKFKSSISQISTLNGANRHLLWKGISEEGMQCKLHLITHTDRNIC